MKLRSIKVLSFLARFGFKTLRSSDNTNANANANAIMVTPSVQRIGAIRAADTTASSFVSSENEIESFEFGSPSEFVAHEFAATWQWRIETDPELAAALGMLSRRRSRHALDPRSLESFDQRWRWVDRALRRIRNGITPYEIENKLSNDERLSLELYIQQLTDYTEYTRKHQSYLCCVNRLEGPQTDLALYCRYLPLKTRADKEFFQAFLEAIPKQLEEVRGLLEHGLSKGITPPRVSLSGVVDQIRGMVEGNLESFAKPIHSCVAATSTTTTTKKTLSKEDAEWKDECEALLLVAKDAFSAFADFLENEYVPNLRTEISASKGYPNGEEYYADCLKFHTTTSMTPEEIHQLGLDEVRRVRKEMEVIASSDGYDGQLEEYLTHLRTSPEFEPSSPETLLARYRDITGRLYPALLNLFHMGSLPRQPLEITETPRASASMAPAAYYLAGSCDKQCPRPGVFYVNTSQLETRRTYECEALALHEAIPGHHIQGAIQAECDLPEFRKHCEDRRYFEAPCRFPFYTGYIEGWGLHSETLGEELGVYTKPTDRFGQLSMEAIRCCRLVVDTGMHGSSATLGWTQEAAVQFMLENTAMGEHDARTEVARYITWPGQATAYKVGERFMRKMRDFAEDELQEDFDVRDFYDTVLLCGAVPLEVLEARVREYVTVAKTKNKNRNNNSNSNSNSSSDRNRNRVTGEDSAFPKPPSPSTATSNNSSAGDRTSAKQSMMDIMTFAAWCKCCVVPGSCQDDIDKNVDLVMAKIDEERERKERERVDLMWREREIEG